MEGLLPMKNSKECVKKVIMDNTVLHNCLEELNKTMKILRKDRQPPV
jgi:hypothetical protein